MKIIEANNCCVMCGNIIPESYQVCQSCIDAATNVTHKNLKGSFHCVI